MDVADVVWRLLAVFVVFLTFPLLVSRTEHKVMAHMQGRAGPMYAGAFHGRAQLIVNGAKFAQKEDVVPAGADRRVCQPAPAVALLPYLLVLIAVPFAPGAGVGKVIDAGILYRARRDIRARRDRGRRAGPADGRLGLREHVLPARRSAYRRAAQPQIALTGVVKVVT